MRWGPGRCLRQDHISELRNFGRFAPLALLPPWEEGQVFPPLSSSELCLPGDKKMWRPVGAGSGAWVSCPLLCLAPHPFPCPCRSTLTTTMPSTLSSRTGCSPHTPWLCKHPSAAGTEQEGRVLLAPALSCPPAHVPQVTREQPQATLCLGVRLSCSLLCSLLLDSQLHRASQGGGMWQQACHPMHSKSQSLLGNTKLSPGPVSS